MKTRPRFISVLTLTLVTAWLDPAAAQPAAPEPEELPPGETPGDDGPPEGAPGDDGPPAEERREVPSPEPPPPPPPPPPAPPAPRPDDVGMTEDEFFGDDGGGDEAPTEPEVDTEAPPPVGKGSIVGRLTNREGLPVLDAQVTVVGGGAKTLTDIEGRFRLDLPPGSYDIRFFSPGYDAVQLRGVVVASGESVEVAPSLSDGAENMVETVEIEVEADTSSIEGQLLTRKRGSVVGDGLGREEIARTPDRDAASAAKRVVGVLIVNGKYVYVRGIGERYTNALLDGSPLPSPEPEQQTVPLDLFPTTILDSLTVVKTFTPDQPGNFAGGSVRIGTRRLPDRFTFSLSGSLGFNTQSTFQNYLQYKGGKLDALGVDDGTRALPDEVPPYQVGPVIRKPDGSEFGENELRNVGLAVNSFMSTRRTMAPPDHRFSATLGNTFELGHDQRLGLGLAASYSRSFERRPRERIRTFRASADAEGNITPELINDLTMERGIDQVRWSGMAGLSYEFAPEQRLHLTGLYSVSSDNEAFEVEGPHRERDDVPVHETRLTFQSRNLIYGQLRGEHGFEDLWNARLDWNASVSRAFRDQPDTRATVYQREDEFNGYKFEDDSQSGWHFFSQLEEMAYGFGMDWSQPLAEANGDADTVSKLKIGGRVDTRDRDFFARRLRFRPTSGVTTPICEAPTWDPSCPDRTFSGDKIANRVFTIEDNTNATDAYTANVKVFAAYAMADIHLARNLRLIAGPRIEVASQSIHTFDQFEPENANAFRDAEVTGADILPGASLVWEVVENMNLRLAASRTVARPQLREIAPFSFTDYFGGFQREGNPDLVFTHIWNGDLRWEWFPTLREVLAASIFVKRFEDPIEEVVRAGGNELGLITYQNTPGANLVGGELEARKNLDFLADELDDLAVMFNVTLAFSRATLGDDASFLTSQVRPLVNQAPWIINGALDYDNADVGFQARLLYNVIGPRIIQVGTGGLPDFYEQPRHQLDVTVSQEVVDGLRVNANAKNLINDDLRATVGEDDVEENLHRQYRTGIDFSVGASYTY